MKVERFEISQSGETILEFTGLARTLSVDFDRADYKLYLYALIDETESFQEINIFFVTHTGGILPDRLKYARSYVGSGRDPRNMPGGLDFHVFEVL